MSLVVVDFHKRRKPVLAAHNITDPSPRGRKQRELLWALAATGRQVFVRNNTAYWRPS